MRKTITGTGGMLLLQTLKDAGVEYLFTNPGSAETGIFAAIAEDGDQRLVVGKHEGLVAAMADGYHRISGKVGVVIAHVMGGSYQLAGQLFNAQVAGSSLLVIAGDWASEFQDYRGLAPFPGLSQAESMRPITKEARASYQVHANPAAITVATIRALREATTPPTGPVYLSISAELLLREGLEAQIGEGAGYRIERPAVARPQTVEAIARRLAEAQCPVLMFGDDVSREDVQAEAVRLAEALEAPVFASRQIFANFPTRHPLYCGMYPVSKDFAKVTGLRPDLLFLVGCQGVHGSVGEPAVMQIGPNPLLMGRHYPLDLAAQCELRDTLRNIGEAVTRVAGTDKAAGWARQRAKVRDFARLLIEREETLAREHQHD
jgi:benzoylformate decarboxylase